MSAENKIKWLKRKSPWKSRLCKRNENELSWVQDQKNEWKWLVLSSVQKKNENDLSWVQDQKK